MFPYMQAMGKGMMDSEHLAFLKEIEELDLPEEVKKEFWSLSKRVMLSNLNEHDKHVLKSLYFDMKIAWLMKIPAWKHTFEQEQIFAQMDIIFYSLLCSAREGFERRQISTQTTVHQIQMDSSVPRPGFFGKLRRFIGGGHGGY